MFYQIIRIVVLLALVLSGFSLTHWLLKKGIRLNRWLFGIAVFVLIPIPLILFPQMPAVLTYLIYFLCGLCAIVFFELTRLKLEEMEKKFAIKGDKKS